MKQNMSYEEIEAYLLEVPKFTKKNPLEETRGFYQYLLSKDSGMDIKESDFGKIIHIAGTNGKGSVCAYLNAIGRASGYRVGMFTSPHLIDMRERFQINGEMVSKESFVSAFYELEEVLAAYQSRKPSYQPTFFERMFFIMVFLFCKEKLDLLILETGLGGRLDTTNVIEHPTLTIITEIGYDHMAYLGNCIEDIAMEKAGIIKAGVPVVYIDREEAVSVIIEQKAKEKSALCFKVSKNEYKINEIKKKCIDFSVCSRYYDYIEMTLHSCAVYQIENAAIAVRAIDALKSLEQCSCITKDTMIQGIEQMYWPGRMDEVLPQVFIDGAHNEDGVDAFVESVKLLHESGEEAAILLFSAVNDKKYDKMIEKLCTLDCMKEYVITRIPGNRGVKIEELKEQFEVFTNKPIRVFEEIKDAFSYCMQQKGDKDVMYIVGSLYLAGLVKDLIEK